MSDREAVVWRPWLNHASNFAAGWTVTIPASDGALIVAALAVLVSTAGAAAWTIAAFALHQYRSRNRPETGLSRTLQVILRNAGGSVASALEIVQAGHAWSGSVSHAKVKAYCLALWPFLINIAFIVASIFVAKVAISAYEINVIRLQPTNCGMEVVEATNGSETNYQYTSKHVNDIRQSRAYVDACYNTLNGSLGCSSLPVQRLPFTNNTEATCRFGPLCLKTTDNAFGLDTGMLSSQTHLGINARKADRVNFRVATTCSVLSYKDYTTSKPDPNSNDNSTIFEINYGRVGFNGTGSNYTWQYKNLATSLSSPYTVQTMFNFAGPRTSNVNGWYPIPPLNLTDADTSLIFVAANSVSYEVSVFDPLYAANTSFSVNDQPWYLSDRWFNIVGCADQLEICNPAVGGSCSGLLGSTQVLPWADLLGFSDTQKATAARIVLAHAVSHPQHVVSSLRTSALLANDLLVLGTNSPGLPDTQWHLETTSWFQTTLANIQYRVVDFPTNAWASRQDPADWQTTGGTGYGVVAPRNWQDSYGPALEDLCKQQLVRSTDQYQSFLLVGVLIVIIVSCAIIVTSWTLEICDGNHSSRKPGGSKRHKLLAHVGDGKAHLLYTALKDAGYNGWEDELEALPHRTPPDHSAQRDIAAVVELSDGSILFPGPHTEAVGNSMGVNPKASQDDKTPSYSVALLGGHTLA